MAENQALLALQQAIQLEEEGHGFYLEVARKTSDPEGQRMFRILASDEKVHLDIIQRQYQSLEKGKGWLPSPQAKGRPIDWGSPLFPPDKEALTGAIRGNATEQEALLFALDIENRSFTLYRQAAEETLNEAGKAMYRFLAAAEREHFDTVMQRYELLTGRY